MRPQGALSVMRHGCSILLPASKQVSKHASKETNNLGSQHATSSVQDYTALPRTFVEAAHAVVSGTYVAHAVKKQSGQNVMCFITKRE